MVSTHNFIHSKIRISIKIMTNTEKIIYTLALFTLFSCGHKVYVSKLKSGNDVEGYRTNDLFKKNKIKHIDSKDSLFLYEMDRIRDSIKRVPDFPTDHEKFGFYRYAIVFRHDTLFVNSTFNGWRYKKKTCLFVDVNTKVINEIGDISD